MSTAVILAAGRGRRLEQLGNNEPKGFLKLGDKTLMEESFANLAAGGIKDIVLVTGHQAHLYEEMIVNYPQVRTVHNPDYASSGSMYSLYLAAPHVDRDFVLLESDLTYEPRAVVEVLKSPEPNCLLVSGFTDSGDEVWVEAADGNLVSLSKDRSLLNSVCGELVGITKISLGLFKVMCEISAALFQDSLRFEYEQILAKASRSVPVSCLRIDDLIWSEIDTTEHLERARTQIYPRIIASRNSYPSNPGEVQ